MKAHKHLIKAVLAEGGTVSVVCEGDVFIKRSSKYADILEHAESVDECQLIARDSNGEWLGQAFVVHDGDDDTVCDYGCNDWMNAWWSSWSVNH